MTEGLIGL